MSRLQNIIHGSVAVTLLGLMAWQQTAISDLRRRVADLSEERESQGGGPQTQAGVKAGNGSVAGSGSGTEDGKGVELAGAAAPGGKISKNTRFLGGESPAVADSLGGFTVTRSVNPPGTENTGKLGIVTTGELDMELSGSSTNETTPGKPYWNHSQAVGAPDTPEAGDKPTAWAPRSRQSGEQWLALGYHKSVEIQELNIHETHNPGAISKVMALMPDGSEKLLWQGNVATANSGVDSQETSLPVPPGTRSDQIRIYVDTNRVGSWPEIDAVEMVGRDGSRQWASRSSASSSYSDSYATP